MIKTEVTVSYGLLEAVTWAKSEVQSLLFPRNRVSLCSVHPPLSRKRGSHMDKKLFAVPSRAMVLLLVLAVLIACGGCATASSQRGDHCATPPASTNVLLIEPDIILFELTAGGLEEPRADWTEAAKANVGKKLAESLQKTGDKLIPHQLPANAPAKMHTQEQILKLHEVVGQTVLIHKYIPIYELPTKQGCFDWGLGECVRTLKEDTGADYALFVYLRDSYTSPGRAALMVAAALFGVGIQGGVQLGFASLVDLQTGQIVWFNRLVSPVGDLRTPEAAEKAIQELLVNNPL
jgi:hypothetical protein